MQNDPTVVQAKTALEKLEEIEALVASVEAQAYYGHDVDWRGEYLKIVEVLDAE